jgi:hypothetical protein
VRELVWSPQAGPQQALVDCEYPEVFMGGARGGGKTDGVLGKWCLKEKRFGRHFNAVALRRTSVSFADAIERSREIYSPLGGKFNEAKLTWRMPNGGRVSFAYLETISDAMMYQGRNVTDVWIEEAGQYPTPDPINRMFGVLRSAHGVPTQLVLTGNPGGPGQSWIAARYQLIPFPLTPKVHERSLPNGKQHPVAVIPARINDNVILMTRDPNYIDRLQLVGGPKLIKAWIEGDWSAVEGAFFEMWSERAHVLRPVPLPPEWGRYRAMDWGSASPFCILWVAVVQDAWKHPDGKTLPRGALVVYREWYGSTDPAAGGKGLKLTNQEIGLGIVKRENHDPRLVQGVLDPSAFSESGGPSAAETINAELLKARLAPFHEADNRRVAAIAGSDRRGPMSGWSEMRSRLVGEVDNSGKATGTPMIYFFSTCVACIRTVPQAQHDEMKPEDIALIEDHALDTIRYAVMARPWLKPAPPAPKEPGTGYALFGDETGDNRYVLTSAKMF